MKIRNIFLKAFIPLALLASTVAIESRDHLPSHKRMQRRAQRLRDVAREQHIEELVEKYIDRVQDLTGIDVTSQSPEYRHLSRDQLAELGSILGKIFKKYDNLPKNLKDRIEKYLINYKRISLQDLLIEQGEIHRHMQMAAHEKPFFGPPTKAEYKARKRAAKRQRGMSRRSRRWAHIRGPQGGSLTFGRSTTFGGGRTTTGFGRTSY
jgi:hypothetical protein